MTVDAAITHIGITIITLFPRLQDSIPAGARLLHGVTHRVERGELDGEPAKAIFEVQRSLVSSKGNGILSVQPLKLFLVVDHKNRRNSRGATPIHGVPVGGVIHIHRGSAKASSWRPWKSSFPFESHYKLS